MPVGSALSRRALIDGTIFVLLGLGCLVEGYRLKVTSDPNQLPQQLGPGLYIAILGVVMLLAGICHVGFNVRKADAPVAPVPRAIQLQIAAVVGGLVAYGLLIGLVGYLAASLVFFLMIFRIFGVRNWLMNAVLSVAFAAVCYIVFVHYFGVIFPRGMLFG